MILILLIKMSRISDAALGNAHLQITSFQFLFLEPCFLSPFPLNIFFSMRYVISKIVHCYT